MKRPAKKTKRLSGSPAMYASGHKPSQLWYTPEQYALVAMAALVERRPMTQFAILATLAAADQVVKQHNAHFAARGPKGVNCG